MLYSYTNIFNYISLIIITEQRKQTKEKDKEKKNGKQK